eukprot:scaffold13290_cov150-Isochrysis_galbana.AAC.4
MSAVAGLDELGSRPWPGKAVGCGRARLPLRRSLANAPCPAAPRESWVRSCSQRPSRSAARGQVGPERPSAMPNPPPTRPMLKLERPVGAPNLEYPRLRVLF